MFTWICPKCGREVPPAYDECPDCARLAPAAAPPPGAVAPPPQPLPAAPPPGPKGSRRPLWATGQQEPLPPAPPPAAAPPATASEYTSEAPLAFPPQHAGSALFQSAPPAAPASYAPPAAHAHTPKWLVGVAVVVLLVIVGGGLYWFFGRPQQTSAVIVAPPATAPAAGENPLEKSIEITGVRFAKMDKGIQVTFVLVNHSDSDLPNLAGTASVLAKTQNSGQEAVGSIHFQTGIPAQASKELTLPFDTKLKMVDMPDWQNVQVAVKITSPPAA